MLAINAALFTNDRGASECGTQAEKMKGTFMNGVAENATRGLFLNELRPI
jgi:hypothetical protein